MAMRDCDMAATVRWGKGLARGLAWLLAATALVFSLSGCTVVQGIQSFFGNAELSSGAQVRTDISKPDWFDLSMVPAYSGSPSVEVAGNTCQFADSDFARQAFEEYSPLDWLGRCGTAFVLVGRDTMPDDPREDIGEVHPSGWNTNHYQWIDGEQLFNRCHLVGFMLAGENANEFNLITGTRSMNTQGMLPYEIRVADYVRDTGNHVLYRVTPVFEGGNLVASGVLMEAESVEDAGAGINFCVWCYNVEPGVAIDYRTGDNWADGSIAGNVGTRATEPAATKGVNAYGESTDDVFAQYADASYVLNTGSHKFHRPTCQSVVEMKPDNREAFYGTRDEAIAQGYEPCGACNP